MNAESVACATILQLTWLYREPQQSVILAACPILKPRTSHKGSSYAVQSTPTFIKLI
jgi:hypothetical protein